MPMISGTEGNDLLIGSDGPDDIFGLGGSDTIEGRAGADIIDAGSGDDVISGEGDADIMTGGTGVDRFRDTAAGLNGDRITDLLPGDRIQLTDLTLQNANIGISGSAITFNGGSVTIDNLGPGRLIIRGIQSGGVEIRLQGIANNDFDGDGRSDVLWHSNTGRVTNWLGQLNGGFVGNFTFADGQAGIDWHIVGTGDFNGDGRSDVLWRNDDGSVTDWLGQANGGFTSNFANAFGQVDNSWQIAGTGDFNGDGRDDVLWHSNTGRVTNWLGQSHGGFAGNFANADGQVGTDWHIVGTGDFNGDGRDDVLWRNDDGSVTNWLGQTNGGFASNFANAFGQVDRSWQVAGTGDFNGDGLDDVLWHSNTGRVTNWLGQANGGFVGNFLNADGQAGTDWHIVATGDYNGDGRDDVLWRNDNGSVTNWLGAPNGGFVSNFANAFGQVDNSWHVQPPTDFLL